MCKVDILQLFFKGSESYRPVALGYLIILFIGFIFMKLTPFDIYLLKQKKLPQFDISLTQSLETRS